ncbi:hypothetical protein GSbR_37800 [Geobacter sp. SVR]|nr:hypothetical protein GSVR_03140 [Geobacter sp. SVR]GCF87180.1 hypothetical protein GSbR_37800 [Geobacter sp. SVR]
MWKLAGTGEEKRAEATEQGDRFLECNVSLQSIWKTCRKSALALAFSRV